MYEKPEYLKDGPRKYEEIISIEPADEVEQEKAQEVPQAKVFSV